MKSKVKNNINQDELNDKSESLGAKDYFEQYWRYCNAVRNWLVAFGIGCCILLISEKDGIFKDVSTQKKLDIVFFLIIGVISQILLALLNKYIHWCVYWGMENRNFEKSIYYKIAFKISSYFWIDVLVDVFTIFMFAIAVCKMFRC